MNKKINEFVHSPIGRQIYSFAKTYITVFLGIYLTLTGFVNDVKIEALPDFNPADLNVLAASAKGALVAVIRNVYKFLTE